METKAKVSAAIGAPPFWKSPQAIFMVVAGLSVAILGPYLMWRNVGPHPHLSGISDAGDLDPESKPLTVDGSLDLTELDGLPKSLHDGAVLLLTTDTPEPPGSIASLPDPTSEDLLRPVSEAILENQPTLYWQPTFGTPPFSVTVLLGDHVMAQGQGISNTSWTVPVPLPRPGNYTWQLTSGGVSAHASFRVVEEAETRLWNGIYAEHGTSHLAMGTVAEQMGMLGVAEREYNALVKDHPQSETAARLLSNVQELRER